MESLECKLSNNQAIKQNVEGLKNKNTKNMKTIEVEKNRDLGIIWLNRPEIRNAMNDVMIGEIIAGLDELERDEKIRIVILRGKGKSFCSGADLNWMREVVEYGYEKSFEESKILAQCFYKIYTLEKPTIAVVHGAAIGGANGLLAACDFVYCADDTIFSLSEVKIGLVPAAISPYVLKRVGEFGGRELIISGKRITGKEAEKFRLVNKSVPLEQLEQTLAAAIKLLRTSGPEAMKMAKELIQQVSNNLSIEKAIDYTADMIAKMRISDEGQEGMAAFLEKRKPNWVK